MRVALFTTCLVDHLYPQVARGVERVLRRVGVDVELLSGQTCCGQLPFNDGFWPEARRIAEHHLDVFSHSEAVVAPSGSCAAMVRHFYPLLFADDPLRLTQVSDIAARTFEFSEFLVRRLQVTDVGASFSGRVTYLASCHGYRELHLWEEPLRLLRAVRGLDYVPLEDVEECCGFGGAFSVKMAELSGAMLDAKIEAIRRSGAQVVTGTDVSCLMHLDGGLRRRGLPVRALHLAQILAGEP
ncbi:MAG: (Fe-S)-binding protein [Armatimonadetes bacterium]|nr:(Fe-S)-binding protein [Armatimonadota bacterium]